MRWMRWGSLEQFSPLGLLATGVIIGAGTPVVKKGLRNLAVLTARGVLAASDAFKETGEQVSNNWQQMVREAREQREMNKCNIREQLHTAGVSAVKGGLTVTDEIQGLANTAREKINQFVEEARKDMEESIIQATKTMTEGEKQHHTCQCSHDKEDD